MPSHILRRTCTDRLSPSGPLDGVIAPRQGKVYPTTVPVSGWVSGGW